MQLQNKPTLLNLPTFPEFVPFSSVDRKEYENFISKFEPYSDYGYTSLYAWSRTGDHYASQLHGNLVLSLQDYMSEKKVVSFMGMNAVPETAHVLLSFVSSEPDYADELILVPEVTAEHLLDTSFKVEEDRDNHDYILSTQNFVDLPGPEFAHTRRKLSQFQRKFGESAQVVSVDLHDNAIKKGIQKLSYEWAFMGTGGSVSAHEEISAIERLLKDIDTLNINKNIHCLALYIDRVLTGFCIFETRNDIAIVHFIKADVALCGASDYMMISTMRDILQSHGISRVNHEQDLGIEGLRAAKIRYCPTHYLKKFKISYS